MLIKQNTRYFELYIAFALSILVSIYRLMSQAVTKLEFIYFK